MPISYTIDIDRQFVLTLVSGTVTGEEVYEYYQLVRNDPSFDPGFRQLVDMTGMTKSLVGTGGIMSISRDHHFTPGVRRAIVASSEAAFGLARMFALHSESVGQTIEVFRDLNAAEAWLFR